MQKQVNAEDISFVNEVVSGSITVVVRKDKLYIGSENKADTASQKTELLKDLDYLKGFLTSVEKKLSNEKFVKNAKVEVIELERKKKEDTEAKIKTIEDSLAALG